MSLAGSFPYMVVVLGTALLLYSWEGELKPQLQPLLALAKLEQNRIKIPPVLLNRFLQGQCQCDKSSVGYSICIRIPSNV